jgi:hypothetical protein
MTDQTSSASAPALPEPPFSAFDEVSSFLLWLSKRWPVLGLAGLVLATLLWMDFIRVFDLPVSFVSPGMLSALPILGLSVCVPVVGVMVVAALMAFALWRPIHANGPSLMAWYAGRENAQKDTADGAIASVPEDESKEVRKKDATPDMFTRWMALCTCHAAYWIAYVGLVAIHVRVNATVVWGLGYAVPAVFAIVAFWPVFRAASPGHRPSSQYLLLFAGCSVMQTTLAGLLLLPLLSLTPNGQVFVLAYHLEAYFFAMVGLGIAQLITAKLVIRGWRRGLLKKVFLLVMGLLGILALFPDVGGQLASYRLRLNGPGRESCMVLTFRSGTTALETVPKQVVDPKLAGQSVSLNFVTRIDDMYYAKQLVLAGPTYLIPASSVGGVQSCQVSPGRPVP